MPLTMTKAAIGFGVVSAAMVYLGVAAARSGWVYALTVDQYLASPRSGRVRLTGRVEALARREAGADFHLAGAGGHIAIAYRGVVPDLLKAGGEAVVEGEFRAGMLEADTVLTRCSSKYEHHEGAP